MPLYEYVRGDVRTTRRASFAEADVVHAEMYAQGYRQVYSTEMPIIGLTFWEAMKESDDLLQQADRGQGPLVGMDGKNAKKTWEDR